MELSTFEEGTGSAFLFPPTLLLLHFPFLPLFKLNSPPPTKKKYEIFKLNTYNSPQKN